MLPQIRVHVSPTICAWIVRHPDQVIDRCGNVYLFDLGGHLSCTQAHNVETGRSSLQYSVSMQDIPLKLDAIELMAGVASVCRGVRKCGGIAYGVDILYNAVPGSLARCDGLAQSALTVLGAARHPDTGWLLLLYPTLAQIVGRQSGLYGPCM